MSLIRGEQITGSIASASIAISASYALSSSYAATASLASNYLLLTGGTISGSLNITGSIILSGSAQGNPQAQTVSSNTASIDLSSNNFFTVQLVSGSNVHINPTNIRPGQTATIRVNTTGSGTVSFPSTVKQASGSNYTATTGSGAFVDILSMITYDSNVVYLVNAKNFI